MVRFWRQHIFVVKDQKLGQSVGNHVPTSLFQSRLSVQMLVKYSKRPKFLKCDVMAMNRVEPQHIHIPISSSNLRLSIVNDLGKIEGNPGLPSTSAMESPGGNDQCASSRNVETFPRMC